MSALAQKNAARWAAMQLHQSAIPALDAVAHRLVALGAKSRYKQIQTLTGVPWFIIAVIHEREASQNWNANLAQGDPWNRRSVHVPAGRGPFKSFEAAAVDALANCAPYAAKNKDWSSGSALELLEKYNGLGYANRGLPSPYIWSGSNQYLRGKYVRDGVFDPNAVDAQLGCAPILARMMVIDSSIKFDGTEGPKVADKPKVIPLPSTPQAPVVPPAAQPPAPQSPKAVDRNPVTNAIVSVWKKLFG